MAALINAHKQSTDQVFVKEFTFRSESISGIQTAHRLIQELRKRARSRAVKEETEANLVVQAKLVRAWGWGWVCEGTPKTERKRAKLRVDENVHLTTYHVLLKLCSRETARKYDSESLTSLELFIFAFSLLTPSFFFSLLLPRV